MTAKPYRWAQLGDINAFFGLMLDNVANLVVLAGILLYVFGFPAELVYTRMFPGTALGVMFGDLVYTWLAFRLAARTGRDDVTAMPLGLDAPSTIGMAFAVLGPAFIAAKASAAAAAGIDVSALTPDQLSDAATFAWHVGTATMILIGVFKLVMSFFGGAIQRAVPQAGLLGTLAGIGIALLGVLQLGDVFSEPIVGLVSLMLILYALVARIKFPFKAPEVLVSAGIGVLLFFFLHLIGFNMVDFEMPKLELAISYPIPTLGFVAGLPTAFGTYLPVAIPFALLTVVGGINVTESARIAGDDYDTREILLTEAIATLLAGLCGGVSQSTPYIGHPAYKAMGGRAGYTLATGLFVGLGGMLGYIPFMAKILPVAALAPIFVFVGIDIVEQSFIALPKKYAGAVVVAMFPNIAQLIAILLDMINPTLLKSALDPAAVIEATHLPPPFIEKFGVFVMLAHGFILTGMLWGAVIAHITDRKAVHAAVVLLICSALATFGVIHSVLPTGGVYLPWTLPTTMPWHWTIGYAAVAVIFIALGQTKEFKEAPAEH